MPAIGYYATSENSSYSYGNQYPNNIADISTMPEDGWLYHAYVRAGGYQAAVQARICIWRGGDGALLYASPTQNWAYGRSTHGTPLPNIRMRKGDNWFRGFWRPQRDWISYGLYSGAGQYHLRTNYAGPIRNYTGYSTYRGATLVGRTYYVANARPVMAGWRNVPQGQVGSFNPVFQGYLHHPRSEGGRDYTTRIQVRIYDRTIGRVVYNRSFNASDAENRNGYFSRRLYQHVAGHDYWVDFRHRDSWGLWSPFGGRTNYTTNSGPDRSEMIRPGNAAEGGRIQFISEGGSPWGYFYHGTYEHPNGLAQSAVQVRVFNANGSVLLYNSGKETVGVFDERGWFIKQFHENFDWGRGYQVQARAWDSSDVVGPWGPRQRVRTNAQPFAPDKQVPANGVATSDASLSARVRDPDNERLESTHWQVRPVGGALVIDRVVNNPQANGATPVFGATGNLTLGTEYEWRVQSNDGTLDSPWTGWERFVFSQVPGVSLLAPSPEANRNVILSPSGERDPEEIVEELKTQELPCSDRNLLSYNLSSVEEDLDGFVAEGTTIARSTEQSYGGSASLQVDLTGDTATGVRTGNGYAAEVTTGTQVTASAYVLVPEGKTVRLFCGRHSLTGAFLGTGGSTEVTGTGEWQRLVAPETTQTDQDFRPTVYLRPITAEAFTVYLDDLQIQEGAVATEWEPGNKGERVLEWEEHGRVEPVLDENGNPSGVYNYIERVNDGDVSSSGGEWCWRAAYSNGQVAGWYQESLRKPVDTGLPAFLTVWAKTEFGTPSTHFRLQCLDADGNETGFVYPQSLTDPLRAVTPNEFWTRYGGLIGAPDWPAGTVEVRVQLFPNAGNVDNGEGAIRFDAFLLQIDLDPSTAGRSDGWYGYFDGDSGRGEDDDAYGWEGMPGNSPSYGINRVTRGSPLVGILYDSDSGTAKGMDRMWVEKYNGEEWLPIYDSGWIESAREEIPPPPGLLQNETRYRLRVSVRDVNGLEGGTSWVIFDVDYIGPHELIVTQVAGNDEDAVATIVWEPTTLGEVSFVKYQIRVADSGVERVVAEITDPEVGEYTYPFPKSGIDTELSVRQVEFIDGEEIQGAWRGDLAALSYQMYFVKDIHDPLNNFTSFHVYKGREPTFEAETDTSALRPRGVSKPVHYTSEDEVESGQLNAGILNDAFAEAKLKELEALISRHRTCALMTTRPAETRFAMLSGRSRKMEQLPWYATVTFDFEEDYFEEDVEVREDRELT